MAGLASILRFMGGIPGRLSEAQYEHTPEYRERIARMDLGDDLGEADVPTGDMEPRGEKRTGRLSKFGKFTKGALPEILRGALVAASNPTPGKVGTAADIFGAVGAVGEDKQNRDMLSYKIQRQLEQDAMDRRLNNAKARDYEAQADYNQWRTQQVVKGRGAEKPSTLDSYKQIFDHLISLKKPDGTPQFTQQQAHEEAASLTNKSYHPALYNLRTPGNEAGMMNAKLKEWQDSAELRAQYPKFEDYYKSTGLGQAKANTAEQVASSTAKEKLSYAIPKILKGAGEYFEMRPFLGADGKVTMDSKRTGVETPKPSPGKPARPRYRLETDKDGIQWRINVDNPEDKVKTGIEKKVSGNSGSDLRQQLIQSLAGGGSKQQQKKADPLGVR